MSKGVSTAEKRAELLAAGEEWPVCGCGCGGPMLWKKDVDMTAGGQWRCTVKTSASSRKYRENNREAVREYKRKYQEKNREAILEHKRKYYEENREALLERACAYYEEKARKASAVRRRLAKLHNLTNNPSATPAEREAARLHAARLTERMIHGS